MTGAMAICSTGISSVSEVEGIIAGQSNGKETDGNATASKTQEKVRNPHMAGHGNQEGSFFQHPALPPKIPICARSGSM
jgi:hypothetical protein